jgi:hypothetical protein
MALPALGDQRLISPLDWHNVGRTWEAVQVSFAEGPWAGELFSADTRNTLRKSAGGKDALLVSGLQVRRAIKDLGSLELLILGRTIREGPFDETGSLRAEVKRGKLKLSGESVLQATDGSKRKAEAWACALRADVEASSRFSISTEHSAASGDPDSSDGLRRTFDPIQSFGHFYLGHADLVGWKNIRSMMLGLKAKLRENLNAHLDLHGFQLVDSSDAWYGTTGPIRAGKPGASKDLGKEADLYIKGKIQKGLGLWAGCSRFQPGEFVKDTGIASPTDWAFLQTAVDW